MIKIFKKSCPPELTDTLKKELTDEYKSNGSAVWKKSFIEKALLESSYNKCCYCECKIDRESKYMEVEHFNDKGRNPDLVVEWENLLPSCKRCNGHKATFDTVNNPFINPAVTNPKNHLILSAFWLYPISKKGKNTIDELFINDPDRMIVPRFEITNAIYKQLEELYERIENYHNGIQKTSRSKNRIINTIESLMREGLPESEYAATVSTSIINNVNFLRSVELMEKENLWNKDLEDIHNNIKEISLDTDIAKVKNFLSSANSY